MLYLTFAPCEGGCGADAVAVKLDHTGPVICTECAKPLPTEEESDKAIVEAEARRDLNDHPPISFS